jgi:hypothetical protein
MRKFILTFIIIHLLQINSFAQVPISNTIPVESKTFLDCTPGTYLKDINGIYNPYLGNWTWTNGNEKITFTFKKITR